MFGRRKQRPSSSDAGRGRAPAAPSPRARADAIVAMAAARLEARGIPTVCGSGQYGPELRGELEGGPFTYYLGNTIDELLGVDESQWDGLLDRRIAGVLAAAARSPDVSAEEWRAALRTRIINANSIPEEFDTVTRPFCGPLVLALYLRTSGGVRLVGRDEDVPLGVEEMFEIGQANSEAEPYDEFVQIDAEAWAIASGSVFAASRAANLGGLIGREVKAAPRGMVFSIPGGRLLGFAPVADDDPLRAVRAIAQFHANQTGGDAEEVLTRAIHYWAPDGTIEELATGDGGAVSVRFAPGERFSALLPPETREQLRRRPR